MQRIALIGFMGAGKTTVGRTLAGRLHSPFVDTDEFIETSMRCSISEIFKASGEAYFRRLEYAALAALTASPTGCVAATGGGLVTQAGARQLLRAKWRVCYLHASLPSLVARLAVRQETEARPLLAAADNLEDRIAALFSQRLEIYQSVADCVVDTTELTVDQVVDKVKDEMPAFDAIDAQPS